jgi:predicted ferric reductase
MTSTLAPVDRAQPAAAAPPARPTPPHPGAHPGAVLGTILAGAVATILLWWHDTTSISGLGDWLTNAGRVTGLLAGYGVVVLIALMARIPPLERGIGADKLARWHAMGGRYTVSLVVAHGLLITWGYAVQAHTNVISQADTLLMSYPDVLMASVGGLLLVAVGLVSARAARRRMRYETWYLVHLYTYLAVALAFSHQFATGADFINNRPARFAWSLLYLGVAGAIVWYRFAVPIRQAIRHRLRVYAMQTEGPGVVSIFVSGRRLNELNAESGQFFRWRFLTSGLWWAANPYSLSAAPRGGLLRITVKNLGAHSAALRWLRPGTRVLAEGPYGAMTRVKRRNRKVLLIAGGIGITPLRALFESLPGGPGDVRLLYRVSRESDVVFGNELVTIAQRRGAPLHVLTGSRDRLGYDPLSAECLAATVPDLKSHDVYVCGPDGMICAVLAALRQAGVPRRHIHHESFEF